MEHPIHKVTSVEVLAAYELRLAFDDGMVQVVDLEPILQGDLYGPLREPALFRQVMLDDEVGTIVWPNGADFHPAILHDWPSHSEAMRALAARWSRARA